MIGKQTIAIVIPFYNEEGKIGEVICSLPHFIDWVILINDGSIDGSLKELETAVLERFKLEQFPSYNITKGNVKINENYTSKVFLLNHSNTLGKGTSIAHGYEVAKMLNASCIVTIDGDGQMAPNEIEHVCEPIVRGQADYAKGNRLTNIKNLSVFPFVRLVGLIVLSMLNKLLTGYWHICDSQTGFTAIKGQVLKKIKTIDLYPSYGYPNDMLFRLKNINAKVVDVPVTPIYPEGGSSKMNVIVVIPKIVILLLKLTYKRLFKRIG